MQLKQGRLRQEVMEYPMTLEWFPLRKRVDAMLIHPVLSQYLDNLQRSAVSPLKLAQQFIAARNCISQPFLCCFLSSPNCFQFLVEYVTNLNKIT